MVKEEEDIKQNRFIAFLREKMQNLFYFTFL